MLVSTEVCEAGGELPEDTEGSGSSQSGGASPQHHSGYLREVRGQSGTHRSSARQHHWGGAGAYQVLGGAGDK